ncbi:hypothetical protein Pelo_18325 [Pelomyxa schiedti]|nr:hypothetical protein Pelo_18325 [Pelomyxa schiedti]
MDIPGCHSPSPPAAAIPANSGASSTVVGPLSTVGDSSYSPRLLSLLRGLLKLGPYEEFLRHPDALLRCLTHCDPAWLTRPYLDGEYPLHIACKKGYVKTTRYLIDECHCDVNITDEKTEKMGMSPLHLACFFIMPM